MDLEKAVELAKENNSEAIAYLYETTYKNAFYVALKYMQNEHDAYDVVQDSYIKAFKELGQLSSADKFTSWLSTIVAHKALDAKKKKVPTFFSETEDEESGTDISDTFESDRVDISPELAIDQKETSRLINEMISDLTDEQRFCITMFYMEDMSVKEIAQVLGVSENTVKSRLNYGRTKIKDKVIELEKKGTKLYGLLPLAFFIALFKTEAQACEVTVPSVESILSATGANASSTGITGGKITTESAAKGGLKVMGKTVSMKVAAIATTAAVGVGVVGVGIAINNDNDYDYQRIYIDFDGDDNYTEYIFDYEMYANYCLAFTDKDETTRVFLSYETPNNKIYAKMYDNNICFATDVDVNGNYCVWLSSYEPDMEYNSMYSSSTGEICGSLLEENEFCTIIARDLYEKDFDYTSWVDITELGTKDMSSHKAYKYSVKHQDEWLELIAGTNESISEYDTEDDEVTTDSDVLPDTEEVDSTDSPFSGSWTTDYPGANAGYVFDLDFDNNEYTSGDAYGVISYIGDNQYRATLKGYSDGTTTNIDEGIIYISENTDGTLEAKTDLDTFILKNVNTFSWDDYDYTITPTVGTYSTGSVYNTEKDDIKIIFSTETSGEIYENGNHGNFTLKSEDDELYSFTFDNGESFDANISPTDDVVITYHYTDLQRYGIESTDVKSFHFYTLVREK
ncbi:MAG: sigma-70 family RNA polymerase sigma factor [Pseudobutyrivibrio ruminis]|uniref:sigma-70 family RNA polymerase sigma factor n=1 Tax=Pseudobutyrivibrio ruminis TaxID=46206 RepID=UPI0026F10D41|nr:sigma-70 family RNA polymerase sigma factor [Pseudobutyrivibrio ruminis]MBE5913037.1 sigma-70 family RNA polymerase sigma factor [Pseudobutyrivibrio ruminis]